MGILLWVSQDQSEGVSPPSLIWRVWGEIYSQEHSGCWQNSVSCSYRTKEQGDPCWLLTRDHCQFLEAPHVPWLGASPTSMPAVMHWSLLVLWSSLAPPAFLFFFCHYLRRISAFKGSYACPGPIRIIQDDLFKIGQGLTLMTSARSLFSV